MRHTEQTYDKNITADERISANMRPGRDLFGQAYLRGTGCQLQDA